jgi:hypothetical protein
VVTRAAQRVDEPPVGGHGYGADMIGLFLRLVLVAGVSLRGASRVLSVVSEALGLELKAPNWTTGRLWLLRLGHAMLRWPLEQALDWAWLIDHSVQIGREKCLVILGIRLSELPAPGESLRHQDMKLIELLPATSWTCAEVDQALERAARRTGVPRVIVEDHGGDVRGGVILFQQRHPQTVDIYDLKHKAACLLRRRMEKDPRWREFQARVGQTRCAVQQTELAFLAPPSPRPKARFMNLEPQLRWGKRLLAILRQPPPSVLQLVTPQRLVAKLGWMRAFTSDLKQWSQWQQVMNVAVKLINDQGIHRGVARMLQKQLNQMDALDDSARQLAAELVEFVREQESQARPGERFPGSSEVLESCLGKFKQLEKQQSRGGFTQLLLGFGALLVNVTNDLARQAMQFSHTADVTGWAAARLGLTVFMQRRLAFDSATKDG